MVDTMVSSWTFLRSGRYLDFKPFLDRTIANGHPLLLLFATVGELRAWASKLEWDTTRVAALNLAIRAYVVLPYDQRVTQHYGPIHAQLGDKLKKFGRK